jgi:hypothetical protein
MYDNSIESDFSNAVTVMPMASVEFSLSDETVQSGEMVKPWLSLSNSEEVAGIQIDLGDTPDNLTIVGATGTDRVPSDWQLTVAELENGTARLLGFSTQGTTIAAGDGPIVELEFNAMASEPTQVSLCTTNEVVSDSSANPFAVNSGCSTIDVTVISIMLSLDHDGGPVNQGESTTVSVNMENPFTVAGIEIHIDDTPEALTGINVELGERFDGTDFTASINDLNGELIILAFSLTGQTLEPGNGSIFDITYQANSDAEDGASVLDFNSLTTFSDSAGNSMYWMGESATIDIGTPDIMLSLVQTSSTTYDIVMNNVLDVQGVQFTISDTPDMLSTVSIEGTDRVPGDFTFTALDQPDGTVGILGFSLSGAVVGAGEGAIATVTVESSSMDYSGELCFEETIISDTDANALFS